MSGWIYQPQGRRFLQQVWCTKKKKKKRAQSNSTQAHTHLVCHLSELENDGSYQIETRQHIKTVVSPPHPLLSQFLCLSVCSLSSPVFLASIISPIHSITLIPEEKKGGTKTPILHKQIALVC